MKACLMKYEAQMISCQLLPAEQYRTQVGVGESTVLRNTPTGTVLSRKVQQYNSTVQSNGYCTQERSLEVCSELLLLACVSVSVSAYNLYYLL